MVRFVAVLRGIHMILQTCRCVRAGSSVIPLSRSAMNSNRLSLDDSHTIKNGIARLRLSTIPKKRRPEPLSSHQQCMKRDV